MNSGQDLGGMQGFGPVLPEKDEPIFHSEWEKRVFAVTLAMAASGKWNIDRSRHFRENMPPGQYLTSTYYQIWLEGLEKLLLDSELISASELQTGIPEEAYEDGPFLKAEKVQDVLRSGGPSEREVDVLPLFRPGDKIIAKNINPTSHTRLPRYIRGKLGIVDRHHGAHVFPDSNAKMHGEAPQHCYSVRFEAKDVWGEDINHNSAIYVDMWEDYLDAAE